MKNYPFSYIDAFTKTPFHGNPCAVFPEADGLDEETMQLIAKETNLNETAFVWDRTKDGNEEADFIVRYFTPTFEVPFAGHPTIATAFLLAALGKIAPEGKSLRTVKFRFNVGVLPVEVRFEDGRVVEVGMEQQAPEFGAEFESAPIAPMLGLSADRMLPEAPLQVVSTGVPFLMVPVRGKNDVVSAEMDRPALKAFLEKAGVGALFLFAPQGYTERGDTYARLLNPTGTSEDPFTGSASGCMGAYLYARKLIDKKKLNLEQGHHLGRPGSGVLFLEGEPNRIDRILLYGAAATTFTGSFER
jgi:trans-2,3-dihydro-3-hydroxyanthranilate isomerase